MLPVESVQPESNTEGTQDVLRIARNGTAEHVH